MAYNHFPVNNRIDFHLDGHRFTKHTHGPKTWPWWRLVVVHIVAWDGGLNNEARKLDDRFNTLKGYNIWIYTRWGAWCNGISWPKVAA